LDASGRFTSQVPQFQGQHCKDADSDIKKDLKKRGRLIFESQIKHSYPFCWRSDSPLIYKAHESWFIGVTKIKDDLVNNNKKAYWVPAFA
jgi:isoleucyl-tRNA synthetase